MLSWLSIGASRLQGVSDEWLRQFPTSGQHLAVACLMSLGNCFRSTVEWSRLVHTQVISMNSSNCISSAEWFDLHSVQVGLKNSG